MSLDAAFQTFIEESREQLDDMETLLLQIEQEEDKAESLNAIFRAAHTIKGSAGLFGLDFIVSFTHGVESLLDQLREGTLELTPELIAIFLSCADHIGDLIELASLKTETPDETLISRGQSLSEQLSNFGVTTEEKEPVNAILPSQNQDTTVERVEGHCVESDNWHISIRFGVDSLRNGLDPIAILRFLCTKGEIVAIKPLDNAFPALEDADPESCYLGFEINFKSNANKQEIDDVFEFIREDSLIRILPPKSLLEDYIQLIDALPEDDLKLGEMLVVSGSLTKAELNQALAIQAARVGDEKSAPLIGDIVVESGMTSQAVLDAAVKKQTQIRETKLRESQSIRVDAEKLDEIINLVGELVIAGAGSALIAKAKGDSAMVESLSLLTGLVDKVRDSTLRLRMVQIGSTFNRFQRVVRDVSKELGKEIDLVINGADTELDKTVIDKIGDPLMHLVRNAIDHGIEPAEVRIANNKPASGVLKLNAYHDSGNVVIEVADDGAGLNRDLILQKAINKGLIAEDALLTDSEIYNLVFAPGFSTAETVTNLSGRGVGMDVVKRNITSLRGSVDVTSQPGLGTTFRVRMPLTLAIIDGFLVGVEQDSFVVPLDMVLECVELSDADKEMNSDRDYINLRGEVLPYIRLRDVFATGGKPPSRENVVVVEARGKKMGLVVDQLLGEFQTVIKPLGSIFNHVSGLGGSTILGNGKVALILDVPGLVPDISSKQPVNTAS